MVRSDEGLPEHREHPLTGPHSRGIWLEIEGVAGKDGSHVPLTGRQNVFLSVDGDGAGATAAEWLAWRARAREKDTEVARTLASEFAEPSAEVAEQRERHYRRLEIVRVLGSSGDIVRRASEVEAWITGERR